MKKTLVAVLMVVLAVGLGAAGARAQDQPPRLKEQRAASKAVNEAVQRYQTMAPPENPQYLASWVDFYDRGDALLADVRGAYGQWAVIVGKALKAAAVSKSDKRLLRRYASAKDAWITSHEEQARLARACMIESPTSTDGVTCFNAMLAEHGASWTEITSRLKRIQRRADTQL